MLRAYDYEGNETNSIADVVRLEKTSTEKSIELNSISAIQLLNPDLLKGRLLLSLNGNESSVKTSASDYMQVH